MNALCATRLGDVCCHRYEGHPGNHAGFHDGDLRRWPSGGELNDAQPDCADTDVGDGVEEVETPPTRWEQAKWRWLRERIRLRRIGAELADVADRERSGPAHPTVEVQGVPIDVALADLIGAVWDAGIDTVSCCQGHGPRANIVFAGPWDAQLFLAAVHAEGEGSLSSRVAWRGVPGAWRYECWVGPWARLMVRIKFPLSDVPGIIAALRRLVAEEDTE